MRQTPGQTQIMHAGSLCMVALMMLLAISPAAGEQAGPLTPLTGVSGLDRYVAKAPVSGKIKVQGSNTLYPLMTRLAAAFQGVQSQAQIDVKGEGSAQSLEAFVRGLQPGQIVIADERSFPPIFASSRELFDVERKQFVESHGYEPTEIPVATDAVAIYVHKDNPLKELTLDQVDAIFSKDHLRGHKATIQQWGDLGLSDEWKTRPIHLYGRDRRSGTYGFFRVHALAGGEFNEKLREEPGAASVVMMVGQDPFGIGYSGLGLQTTTVRMIPLAASEGMPYVIPSASTIANETYPLHRVLYLYLDKSPKVEFPVAVQEFLKFIASREGQETIVRAGFFPLPSDKGSRTIAKVLH